MGFFKRNKEKIKKCYNASISILLCIIITPVISIAGMLVEFSRYQSTINLLNELMDASTLSVLADYDTYLKDRFGLYAVSQEADISDAYVSYFDDNTALLGGSLSITDTTTASGALSLIEDGDYKVLMQQVIDCSEMTDLVEFFLGDLNLEELLEKFDQMAGIGEVAEQANKVAEAATAIEDVINKAKALKDKITEIVDAINDIEPKFSALVTSITDLYDKITTDSFDITSDDDYKTFAITYLEYVQAIMDNYGDLKDLLTSFPDKVEELTSAVDDLKGSVGEAKVALGLSDSDSGSSSGGSSETEEESGDLFEVVLEAFESAIESAYTTIETDIKDTLKETVDNLANDLASSFISEFNLEKIVNSITVTEVNGEKLVSISSDALEDIKSLITDIYDGEYEAAEDLISSYLPDFENFNLDTLKGMVQGAIDDAEEALKEGVSDAFSAGITDLVNAIKGIFDMDVFYDAELCAYIDDDYDLQGGKTSVIEQILRKISSVLNKIDQLMEDIEDLDIWGLLTDLKELIDEILSTVEILKTHIQNTINKISEVIGWFTGSNQASFYEFLLISAYLTHYLPDRTCAGTSDIDVGAGTSTTNLIEGTPGGFDFSQIPVETVGTSFGGTGLISVMLNLKDGGDDKMFMGAELEYILGGSSSEIMNQINAFFSIYFIRLVLDSALVLADADVGAMATAANVFGWVVYLLVILGEPLLDTVLIVNTPRGEDCPVNIIKSDVYLSATGIPRFIADLCQVCVSNTSVQEAFKKELGDIGSVDGGSPTGGVDFGLSYQMYLWLTILLTIDEGSMMLRFSDIVYLEAAEYYRRNGGAFDRYSTYTAVSSKCSIKLESFLSFIDFADDSVLQKKFTRTRGY